MENQRYTSIDPLQNQPCRVCEEPAAGFHFGAFTCEGCKSFFGRTCNNQSAIQECKNNYRCVVDKKNRTACKACRLRKCLMVGMSKSGSRYGRRSNWFKIHCLMQQGSQGKTQSPVKPNETTGTEASSTPPQPSDFNRMLTSLAPISPRPASSSSTIPQETSPNDLNSMPSPMAMALLKPFQNQTFSGEAVSAGPAAAPPLVNHPFPDQLLAAMREHRLLLEKFLGVHKEREEVGETGPMDLSLPKKRAEQVEKDDNENHILSVHRQEKEAAAEEGRSVASPGGEVATALDLSK